MDGIKDYSKDRNDLKGPLCTSNGIGMEFDLKQGKLKTSYPVVWDIDTTIEEFEQKQIYKYFGIRQELTFNMQV